MNEFPKMLYKTPGTEEIHGGRFSTKIVNDADEQDTALADGWSLTSGEAKKAREASLKPAEKPKDPEGNKGDENVPPTRAELEQKAQELGIEFSPNIGDKKLAERIEAKLAEKPKE